MVNPSSSALQAQESDSAWTKVDGAVMARRKREAERIVLVLNIILVGVVGFRLSFRMKNEVGN
jgi:hypothetical protein